LHSFEFDIIKNCQYFFEIDEGKHFTLSKNCSIIVRKLKIYKIRLIRLKRNIKPKRTNKHLFQPVSSTFKDKADWKSFINKQAVGRRHH
jgi:hypothetical protein